MNPATLISNSLYRRRQNITYKTNWQRVHIDPLLLLELVILATIGFIILFSAANHNHTIMLRQTLHLSVAFTALFVFAQISPLTYKKWAPTAYLLGILLLMAVLVMGTIGKGAQRWLDLSIIRFQPSEILKLAVPMLIARYLGDRDLPPTLFHILVAGIIILIPGLLIMKQPDLGTALMVMISGACVILFSGIRWRFIIGLLGLVAVSIPVLWHRLHDYQKQRLLTFIHPEGDPLGTGYHIIQSKIAVGSGGVFGKGLFHGTQSHLNFLPEHKTDFIFAVFGEEFGFIGAIALLALYLIIVMRGLYIANQAQTIYARLLAGGISLTFFISVFVNMGMVMGVLPVVGMPLPLISYGGTSMVTMMASFGVLMSIHTHRKLIS